MRLFGKTGLLRCLKINVYLRRWKCTGERKREVFRKRNKGEAGVYHFSNRSPFTLRPPPFPRGRTPVFEGSKVTVFKSPFKGFPPRAQTAWQTPLEDTGKPEGARRVRTASLVHLEALTSSSPPPPRHLTSSGHTGRTPSQTAGKMASLVRAAALASSWSQPGLHSSRGSPSSSQDRPKAA